jgi:CcmD family protein
MEHLGYLGAAYAAIFVVIFLYVLYLWRRQTQLETELKALERKLADLPARRQSRPAPK